MKPMGSVSKKNLIFLCFLFSMLNFNCNKKYTVINLGKDDSVPISIDLSKSAGDVITESVPANTNFRLIIKNLVPNPAFNYNILIEVKIELVPEFDLGESISVEDTPDADFKATEDSCSTFSEKYVEAYNALLNATNENEIEDKIAQLAIAMHRLDSLVKADPECIFPEKPQKSDAEKLISNTSKILERPFKLKSGERLEVTIIRSQKGETQTRQWKHIYRTGSRGKWNTSYAFSFIPNVITEETYFTAQKDSGVFLITKEENRKVMDFAPSIFFTWTPSEKENNDFVFSLAGGLGFDFNDPVVFFGGGVHFNQNLGLIVGVAAHKQMRLLGKYSEGDTILTTLETSQLHEELYRVNPFISLSFRFKSNPFSNSTNESQ